jgi:hypothetical protein
MDIEGNAEKCLPRKQEFTSCNAEFWQMNLAIGLQAV